MASSYAAYRPEPSSIPDAPGCYQFRDASGTILYVGKAKSLRSRVSSYFQSPAGLAARTRAMVDGAAQVDWIVVDSEVAALHLEYTLIQRHRPRYNVQYRDDKSYPYLVLTTADAVPRARVQRGRIRKGDRRFGPYAQAYAIRDTLDLLLRIFPVRTCAQGTYDRAQRTGTPCLLHHIDRCAAPCTGVISIADHRALVDGLAGFLRGDTAPVFAQLEAEMRAAATAQNYELAARRRDQIEAARRALEKQLAVSDRPEDFDVIGIHGTTDEAALHALFVRRGRLVGQKGVIVDNVEALDFGALLTSFLVDLYADRSDDVPPMVVVPVEPDDAEVLAELLREHRAKHAQRHGLVTFRVPQRGAKRRLLGTAEENARASLQRAQLRRATDFDARNRALTELQDVLALPRAPLRMECYDISHLGGTDVVGSMVVFEDGVPRKSDYRRFKLRMDRNDDYAAMHEVLSRRFRRVRHAAGRAQAATEAGATGVPESFARLPDLVVIDGGRGQLAAALQALEEAEVSVPVVALAKRFEEVWMPERSRPVQLERGSDSRYLMQRLRDEAHRFAITHQRQRRTRRVTTSVLDQLDGVGPARRRALLQHFGAVARVRKATVDELAAVPGISHTLAVVVHDQLQRLNSEDDR